MKQTTNVTHENNKNSKFFHPMLKECFIKCNQIAGSGMQCASLILSIIHKLQFFKLAVDLSMEL